jgi:serine/threonine-protein kinase
MVRDWGASTGPLERGGGDRETTALDWLEFLVVSALPLVASIYFGVRNLALGRGDRKGATRIALFVFLANLLESAFTTRLSEVGLLSLGWDWVSGRGLAHSLLHGVIIWFAYVALEPYLRRLWPRLLVSWARLVSGRVRDPLVGRDVLIGAVAGAVLTALGTVVQFAALRWGHGRVPTLVGSDMLLAATSLSLTGYNMSYAASVAVLSTLRWLVLVLLLRLLLQRTWPAVVACALLLTANAAYNSAPTDGWLVATLMAAVYFPGGFFVLMRFGLLPGATAIFTGIVTGGSVATLDFSSWYADRALVSMALGVAVMGYGAWTALAGRPIFGDPLREPEPAAARQ